MVVGVSPKQWQALVKVTGTESAVAALQEQLGLDFAREGDRFEARDRSAGSSSPGFQRILFRRWPVPWMLRVPAGARIRIFQSW